jgi:hypothetical protein
MLVAIAAHASTVDAGRLGVKTAIAISCTRKKKVLTRVHELIYHDDLVGRSCTYLPRSKKQLDGGKSLPPSNDLPGGGESIVAS